MSYQIRFMPKAITDINHLDKRNAQRIITKLRWLAENLDNITTEVLSGELKGLFKLRVGSYRVLYTVSRTDRVITIHLVGHRRDIYRVG